MCQYVSYYIAFSISIRTDSKIFIYRTHLEKLGILSKCHGFKVSHLQTDTVKLFSDRVQRTEAEAEAKSIPGDFPPTKTTCRCKGFFEWGVM